MGDSINPNYDESKEFKSWWDLTPAEKIRFARKVKAENIYGWDNLQAAALEFGFSPTDDMPTVLDYQKTVE